MRVGSIRVAAMLALNVTWLAAGAAAVVAQQGRHAGWDAGEHVAWLAQELSLAQAQTERAQEIFEAHFKAMEGIHASHQRGEHGQHHGQRGQHHGQRGQHHDQVAALWRGTSQTLADILTDEQKARYEELQSARRGCMGPPPRG